MKMGDNINAEDAEIIENEGHFIKCGNFWSTNSVPQKENWFLRLILGIAMKLHPLQRNDRNCVVHQSRH